MRGETWQACPDVAIYFQGRKMWWEFGGNGSMSSLLTELKGEGCSGVTIQIYCK